MTPDQLVIAMRYQVNAAFVLCQERPHLARFVMPVGFLLTSLDLWIRDYQHGVQSDRAGAVLMVRSVMYLDIVYQLEQAYAQKAS